MKKKILIHLISVLFLSVSCTSLMGNLTGGLADSLYRQNDVLLVKEGAPSFLLLMEGLIHSNPKDRTLIVSGIQMFSAYSGAFVTDKERKKIFNQKTKKWALQLLETYPRYRIYANIDASKKEEKEEAFAAFLKSITHRDVPYIFWASYSWALSLIDQLDQTATFIELPIPKALIERVAELDDQFYFGAPHLFSGIFYGAYPEAYGGNLARAKEEFDLALKYSEGKLLMTKLFLADFYYRPKFDKENYRKIVEEVLQTDVDEHPEMRLLNIMAKNQAQKMLDNIDMTFFDSFDF